MEYHIKYHENDQIQGWSFGGLSIIFIMEAMIDTRPGMELSLLKWVKMTCILICLFISHQYHCNKPDGDGYQMEYGAEYHFNCVSLLKWIKITTY